MATTCPRSRTGVGRIPRRRRGTVMPDGAPMAGHRALGPGEGGGAPATAKRLGGTGSCQRRNLGAVTLAGRFNKRANRFKRINRCCRSRSKSSLLSSPRRVNTTPRCRPTAIITRVRTPPMMMSAKCCSIRRTIRPSRNCAMRSTASTRTNARNCWPWYGSGVAITMPRLGPKRCARHATAPAPPKPAIWSARHCSATISKKGSRRSACRSRVSSVVNRALDPPRRLKFAVVARPRPTCADRPPARREPRLGEIGCFEPGGKSARLGHHRGDAGGPAMKFGIFYEHQLPQPWEDDAEQRLYRDALEQVELADRLGIDYVWEVEHHFLEEYSHSSAPEVFLAACSQRTTNIRL